MKIANQFFDGYENTKKIKYKDISIAFPNTYKYSDLSNYEIEGVLKANYEVEGKLLQVYSSAENHVGVIAATRLGKTTGYVIPSILSFAKQKKKKKMIISDPKGELYRLTAATLREEGYNVKLLNFRDYQHSDYWNPLTPIYRLYQKMLMIEEEVNLIQTPHGWRNIFQDIIYEKQEELDEALNLKRKQLLEQVGEDIDSIVKMTITVEKTTDPYWEQSAAILLTAILWGMLEDSDPATPRTRITEDTFSFSTALAIMDSQENTEYSSKKDQFFTSRNSNSRAYRLAKNCILDNAPNTRKNIICTFDSKMAIYKSSAIRLITSCNSFDMSELVDDKPIAIFIAYKDELKLHFKIISFFVQNAYTYLINHANGKSNGKLDTPFYFILDEFGNFPKIQDFETVISACAGRNVWFILILQSYAQLHSVYGENTAKIIKDNLNIHIFMGSNNPDTLEEFSKECGRITRLSPLCALNGNSESIENFQLETIPLVPISQLSNLGTGECIVTEANCGYVLFSKLERYYECLEYKNLSLVKDHQYHSIINPLEEKYIYIRKHIEEEE